MQIQPQFTNVTDVVSRYYDVTIEEMREKRTVRSTELMCPRWAMLILLYDQRPPHETVVTWRRQIAEWMNKTPDSIATITSKARKTILVDRDFKNDMKMLREYLQRPDTLIPRAKGKEFGEMFVAEKKRKIERPKAEYSNRNMMEIHDYYANIAI